MFCSLHLAAMSIYGSNHEQRIINVSYRMVSAIAPDRHFASAERVDSSSALVAKVSIVICFAHSSIVLFWLPSLTDSDA